MVKKSLLVMFTLIFSLVLIKSESIFAQTQTPSPALEQTPTPTPPPNPDPQKIQELTDQIAKVEAQLNDARSKTQTLSGQINYMNNQIQLTTLQISDTENKIEQKKKEIIDITIKIGKLENSLDNIAGILLNRVKETYISGQINPFNLLLSSNGFSELLTRWKYIKTAQAHDKKLMIQVQTSKVDFEDQKKLLEQKKKEEESLKVNLQNKTNDLARQKSEKEQLLIVTQNDEKTFQNLLEKARQELAGFSAFTQSAGGGLSNFGNGSNGWYYTQRDPQWGNMTLGNSPYTVSQAGCTITSVAMVCKSYGQEITPISIASNPGNFISGDLWNWAFSCSGKTTDWMGNSQDQVKSYVKNNTPVILRLVAPSVSGVHFIVAFAWDDDKNDFKIHDPYFGPDKYFSERYSWSQVTTGIAIH